MHYEKYIRAKSNAVITRMVSDPATTCVDPDDIADEIMAEHQAVEGDDAELYVYLAYKHAKKIAEECLVQRFGIKPPSGTTPEELMAEADAYSQHADELMLYLSRRLAREKNLSLVTTPKGDD